MLYCIVTVSPIDRSGSDRGATVSFKLPKEADGRAGMNALSNVVDSERPEFGCMTAIRIADLALSSVSSRSDFKGARTPFRFRMIRLPTTLKLARVTGVRTAAIPVSTERERRKTKLQMFIAVENGKVGICQLCRATT